MSPFLGRAQSSRIGPCGEDVATPKHPLCVMPDTGEQGPRGREGHDADPVSWVLLPPHGAQRAGCGEQAGAPTCILASGTSLPARRPAWCTGSEWVYAWGPQFRRRKLRVPGPGRPVVDVRRAPSCNRRRGAGLADPLAPCPPSVPGLRPQSCSGRGPVSDRCPGGGPGAGRSPGAAPTAPLFPAGLGSIPTTSCPSWRLCSSAAGTCTPGSGPVARRGTCCHSRRPGVSVPALPKRETSQPQRDPGTHVLLPLHRGRHPPLTPDPTSTRCLSSVSSRTLRPFARTEILVFLRTHLMYEHSEAQTVLLSRALCQAAGLPNPLPPLCGGWGRL